MGGLCCQNKEDSELEHIAGQGMKMRHSVDGKAFESQALGSQTAESL